MSEILSGILAWDSSLFYKVNSVWIHPDLDKLLVYITDFQNTKYLILGLVGLLILTKRLYGLKVLLGCVVAILISDPLCSQILKPSFDRRRPEFTEKTVRLLVPSQSSESFPSNHAANMFAAAGVVSYMIPAASPFALGIAGVVGYSRVYVGVHYPLDVKMGALVGLLTSLLVCRVLVASPRFASRWPPRRKK